jgi:hypothetical protein
MTPSATRWEFWPPWLFYAPVAVYVAALCARHGVRAIPAANPGLRDGGLVGESKAEILSMLPREWTIPFRRLPAGVTPDRACVERLETGWPYPLIAKPDVGQRGVGVARLDTDEDLRAYVNTYSEAILLQPWHPGPYEAGVFYVRYPGEGRGRIYSMTEKRFPAVTGDGASTLAELIRMHPRYRRQSRLFLARHRDHQSRVIPRGVKYSLGYVGNHAQGAMFVDGGRLRTPALERRIDGIARHVDGFYIGRFDVRYASERAFMAGEDLAIVELNGVTAESTNIYDPSRSLLQAYRTLFEQWRMVFAVGGANMQRGLGAVPATRLAALVWSHLTDRRTFPTSS